MLWAIIKAKLIIDEITTAEQLFEEIQKIWDEIPISNQTINLLIQSFDSKLKTCAALHGESLNEKKKIRKLFQESYRQEMNTSREKMKKISVQKSC